MSFLRPNTSEQIEQQHHILFLQQQQQQQQILLQQRQQQQQQGFSQPHPLSQTHIPFSHLDQQQQPPQLLPLQQQQPQYSSHRQQQPPPLQTQLHRARFGHADPNSGGGALSPASALVLSPVSMSPRIPYQPRVRVTDKYNVIGFISSGTYGRVYKALNRKGTATAATTPSAAVTTPGSVASPAGGGGGGGGGAPTPTTTTSPTAPREFAIKKFKPDKEGELSYTGISQSAIREMSLCTELSHQNVIRLVETILEDKCIYMVFEYAEHDLLQIIHHHTTHQPRAPIPSSVIRSIMFQLLNGCLYLHSNWVLHRDLKPANIMVTSSGEVKIGDLGLARRFDAPLQSLFSADKVVVTIWYRAPELILGSHHYTPAIDLWAVGCIFAELLSLRPIFKGEEAKMDNKKTVPFQRSQMQQIVNIMGLPTKEQWPLLPAMPEYTHLGSLTVPGGGSQGQQPHGSRSQHHQHHHQQQQQQQQQQHHHHHHQQQHVQSHHQQPHRSNSTSSSYQPSPATPNTSSSTNNNNPPSPSPNNPPAPLPPGYQLDKWYFSTITQGASSSASNFPPPASVLPSPLAALGVEGYSLMQRLLDYDPTTRLTAQQALQHPFFTAPPSAGERVSENCFEGLRTEYPHRRVSQEDNDMRTNSVPGTKRTGLGQDDSLRPAKRFKEG